MAPVAPTLSNANANLAAALPSVGNALVLAGMLEPDAAARLHKQSQTSQRSFIDELVDSGQIAPLELAHTLSRTFALPLIDVAAVDLERLPSDLIDPELARRHHVLPLARRGRRLVLVTADPTNQSVAETIKFVTRSSVDWVVGEHDKLLQAVEIYTRSASESLDDIVGSEFEFDEATLQAEGRREERHDDAEVGDAPVVRFLQKMLLDAIRTGASDLHFEPYEHSYRVRFRIDGQLQEITSPPPAIKERLASRIKVLSRLDISEKRIPQDGRMKLRVSPTHVVDFRVSTLPTLFGEKIVIRVLDQNAASMDIDSLGYEPDERARLLEAIHRPYGMILVTGPTGSGKTVSLYSCLGILNEPGLNISTAEDPSEINMPGVNQINVNERAGLTFAVAMRAFLRQDPDVIMVGEIRDLETADIAVKAAQTGHLVLSTVHTNDAPRTLTRLRNMGVAPFNIASSIILITAQRLARRLCTRCREVTDIPREVLLNAGFEEADLDGGWKPYRAVGCAACNNGYKGRVGLYEVMPISDEIRKIILADGSAMEIEAQARAEGIRSMRQAGLLKVRSGITSLQEVLAVTDR